MDLDIMDGVVKFMGEYTQGQKFKRTCLFYIAVQMLTNDADS